MITEKNTIRCEAVFNEDHTHRFLWKRIWNKDKPMAAIIMLNPCQSDNIITDTTTSLVVNNIARLEQFGGVEVCNLYSMLTNKIRFRWYSDDELNDPENDSYIKKAVEESSCFIIAWGRAADANKHIGQRIKVVLELLKPHKEKLFVLSDGEKENLHPLTPSLRSQWTLKPFDWAGYEESQQQTEDSTKEDTGK